MVPSARIMCALALAILICPWAAYAINVFSTPLYATGFQEPTHIANAGDGSHRLFVVEKAGRIRVIRNGSVNPVPFLDITARVNATGEGGLLSIAFPPGFAEKQYFYVYYTHAELGPAIPSIQVSRFSVGVQPDLADPNSEIRILSIPHPTFFNHFGGQLAFGPDGFLYLAPGDGGGGGDPFGNAQNPLSLLGKMLRIDVETPGCVANPPNVTRNYCIPPSNPFALNPAFQPEIWALGLRNPFRFSFDRLTGDLFIGDVGQVLFEEIDFQPAGSLGGQNYGWNIMEAFSCFNIANAGVPLPVCNQADLTLPVASIDHVFGECSVTGGFVYRGLLQPEIHGTYLHGDFCSGRIWALKRSGGVWRHDDLAVTPFNVSTLGEDELGELYLADFTLGNMHRIIISRLSAGNFDGNGTADLARTDEAGRIFVNTNLAAWTAVPGRLTHLVTGNFNPNRAGDELAGINERSRRTWFTADLVTWTAIPGNLAVLVTGDFNAARPGDELAGLSPAGEVLVSTDLAGFTTLSSPPLVQLVKGNFNPARAGDELAGVTTDGRIFVSMDLVSFTQIPGRLNVLTIGNFDGAGADDLAGINVDSGRVWFTTDLGVTWTNITLGNLRMLVKGNFNPARVGDELAGVSNVGQIYVSMDLRTFSLVPGTLNSLVSGNFDGNGADDLAGINFRMGRIWFTTNLGSTWTEIPLPGL